jgi:hypothetical protein
MKDDSVCYWHHDQLNPTDHLPNSQQTSIILCLYTTEIWLLAECQVLCRVFFVGHSANSYLPSATQKPSVKENTRRNSSLSSVLFLTLGKEFLCRVFFLTLGKELFAECFFPTLGKDNLKIIF